MNVYDIGMIMSYLVTHTSYRESGWGGVGGGDEVTWFGIQFETSGSYLLDEYERFVDEEGIDPELIDVIVRCTAGEFGMRPSLVPLAIYVRDKIIEGDQDMDQESNETIGNIVTALLCNAGLPVDHGEISTSKRSRDDIDDAMDVDEPAPKRVK
ncbi:hypothetical protein F5B20DRAFT_553923 [Whalleya microplaca]|nr:hypothetical protein F5B20DRAFT_553923 [Whalleya microplaca]